MHRFRCTWNSVGVGRKGLNSSFFLYLKTCCNILLFSQTLYKSSTFSSSSSPLPLFLLLLLDHLSPQSQSCFSLLRSPLIYLLPLFLHLIQFYCPLCSPCSFLILLTACRVEGTKKLKVPPKLKLIDIVQIYLRPES